MPDDITPELFTRLVELAALELTPQEAEYLRGQLNGQLKAIAELERIPVSDDIPLAAHGVAYPPSIRPPLRADQAYVDPALAERILRLAPEAEEGYFAVLDIPHESL
jgi:aspartyl/glutamyl-tRNA(Asn/Gln) amidotransferase C subunit